MAKDVFNEKIESCELLPSWYQQVDSSYTVIREGGQGDAGRNLFMAKTMESLKTCRKDIVHTAVQYMVFVVKFHINKKENAKYIFTHNYQYNPYKSELHLFLYNLYNMYIQFQCGYKLYFYTICFTFRIISSNIILFYYSVFSYFITLFLVIIIKPA